MNLRSLLCRAQESWARLRTEPKPAPAWGVNAQSHAQLRFTAVPARLSSFGWAIAGVTLTAGALVSMLAILVAPESSGEARIVVVASALVLGIPLTLAVKAPFRWRIRVCSLTFTDAALLLVVDGSLRTFSYEEVAKFIWATGTEYSRCVIETNSSRVSLLVGIARPLTGRRPDLPAISDETLRILTAAGFTVHAESTAYLQLQGPAVSSR